MNLSKNKNFSALNPERGVSLIVTFFIMIVILTIVASLSIILYSEVKVMRNMGNSVVSFYAAEGGIEKVLYYDKQVLPIINISTTTCDSNLDCGSGDDCVTGYCTTYASRGLCSIFDSLNNSFNYCKDQTTGGGYDSSVYCNGSKPLEFTGTCSPSNCTDCTISFTTEFDNTRDYNYNITATIGSNGDFNIDSGGIFGDTQRKINIIISNSGAQGNAPVEAPPSSSPPLGMPPLPCDILNEFISNDSGPTIDTAGVVLDGNGKMTISANVAGDIDYVQANMYIDVDGNCTKVVESIDLQAGGSGTYSKPWTAGIVGTTYYILMDVRDNSLKHTYLRFDPITLE